MTGDRRKYPRVKLRLPVRLIPSEGLLPTETETEDISKSTAKRMLDTVNLKGSEHTADSAVSSGKTKTRFLSGV